VTNKECKVMGEFQVGVEVLKQVPSLGVLIWIVARFLLHMKEMESARHDIDAKRDDHLETLVTSCHAFQEKIWSEARDIFGKTNVALGDSRSACERANDTLLRIERRLEDSRKQ
jgi:hypothetical protein